MKKYLSLFLIIFLFAACSRDDDNGLENKNLVIFITNDMHAQLDNFAKIKHIVEKEKSKSTVLLLSAGDIFSGNPVVDMHAQAGYPIIDIMNMTGYNATVLGNHEFDYGEEALKERIEQSNFDWICANVDMSNSVIPQVDDYVTMKVGEFDICLLGLIETNGKENDIIPSTHPGKVANISFQLPQEVVGAYSNTKSIENTDLFIALTHLGKNSYDKSIGDIDLANQFPYFDFIIGGHSHGEYQSTISGIPIFHTGSHLNNLGKIEVVVNNKAVESYAFNRIDLNTYSEYDQGVMQKIQAYNDEMSEVLDEVIAYAATFHDKPSVGCFYTDALREQLEVDLTFQNGGGIRTDLNSGDITVREIYEIDPFNNGTHIYTMSIAEVKNFLRQSGSGFYYSGLHIEQTGDAIIIEESNGNQVDDETIIQIGINDYIPAVHDQLFPENPIILDQTTAETIIMYLRSLDEPLNYSSCSNYFKYD